MQSEQCKNKLYNYKQWLKKKEDEHERKNSGDYNRV